MSTTIHDILQLPCMREAKVVAGGNMLNRTITSITVMEYTKPGQLQQSFNKYEGPRYNELTITGLFNIADDPDAQCEIIRELSGTGMIAMILYYLGVVVKELNPKVIQTADEVGFILITMPKNRPGLRYSDAIMEISALINYDRNKDTYFIPELLDQFSLLQKHQRSTDILLRMICDRAQVSIFITDFEWHVRHYATWPSGLAVDVQDVVRQVLEQRELLNIFGLELNYQTIKLGNLKENLRNMIVISTNSQQLQNYTKQAGELICLANNIWGMQSGNAGADELIRSLILGEPLRTRRLSKLIGIHTQGLNAMWVVRPDTAPDSKTAPMLRQLLTLFKKSAETFFDLSIVGQYEGSLIMAVQQTAFSSLGYVEKILLQAIHSIDLSAHIFVCSHLEGSQSFHDAYMQITNNCASASLIFPMREVMDAQELQFTEECLAIFAQGDTAVQQYISILSPISDSDPKLSQILLDTLAVYLLDADLSVTRTAELLFVHKNTIKYRLNKISDLLCADITKVPLCQKLIKAAALKRLLVEG